MTVRLSIDEMADVFEMRTNRVSWSTIAEVLRIDIRTLRRYVHGAETCGFAYWTNKWERRRANALYEANERNDKTVSEVRVGGLTALEVFIIEDMRRLRAHNDVVLKLRATALDRQQSTEE